MKRKYILFSVGFIIAVTLALLLLPAGPHTLMLAGAALVICPLHLYFSSKENLQPKIIIFWLSYGFIVLSAVLFFFIYRDGRFVFVPKDKTFAEDTTSFFVEEVTAPVPDTVYVTPSGKKFHYSEECAGKNAIATTPKKAVADGKEPCKKCADNYYPDT